MNRQELIRDIKSECGAFPNISQLAKYMGVSRQTIRTEITSGLEYIETGKSKQYFVNDVADKILRQRNIEGGNYETNQRDLSRKEKVCL